jgi:hypothetical protein
VKLIVVGVRCEGVDCINLLEGRVQWSHDQDNDPLCSIKAMCRLAKELGTTMHLMCGDTVYIDSYGCCEMGVITGGAECSYCCVVCYSNTCQHRTTRVCMALATIQGAAVVMMYLAAVTAHIL